jgi:hypothetical protein
VVGELSFEPAQAVIPHARAASAVVATRGILRVVFMLRDARNASGSGDRDGAPFVGG